MPDSPDEREWCFARQGHSAPPEGLKGDPLIAWLTIDPATCLWEVRAVCRQCQQETFSHLDRTEVERLFERHGEQWPKGQFQYLGWNTEVGLCEVCYGRIKLVQSALN